MTLAQIQAVADAWRNGVVDVGFDGSTITVTFVGELGIPEDLNGLKSALEMTIPAHLALRYEFRYRTWGELAGRTWGSMAQHTWGQALEGRAYDGNDKLQTEKPGDSDNVRVDVLNGNMDVIDRELKQRAGLGPDGKVPAEQLPEMDISKALAGGGTEGPAGGQRWGGDHGQRGGERPQAGAVEPDQGGAGVSCMPGRATPTPGDHHGEAQQFSAGGAQHAAADVSAGTLGGRVLANASAVTALGTAQVRNIRAGTADLTAGSSSLATGEIYFVYGVRVTGMAKGIYVGVSDIKLICPRSARAGQLALHAFIQIRINTSVVIACLKAPSSNSNRATKTPPGGSENRISGWGKARKIRRGYIGVGGVARPFWSGRKELVSYGPITAMSTVRCGHAGGTVGNYALFAGGQDANTYVSTVDTYNTAPDTGVCSQPKCCCLEPCCCERGRLCHICWRGKRLLSIP